MRAFFFSRNIFFLIAATFVFASCDRNRIFEKNKEIKDYLWDSKQKAAFTFEIADTTKLYNIYVNVRHADFYEFSNMWLIRSTTFPDGKKIEKRIEIPLASGEGKWYGEGMGDIWDCSSMIEEGIYFNQQGKYTIEFEQNMRKDPLPGIMAIGVRVENTQVSR
jgi:gliding motility-associated lipoprotein GldH